MIAASRLFTRQSFDDGSGAVEMVAVGPVPTQEWGKSRATGGMDGDKKRRLFFLHCATTGGGKGGVRFGSTEGRGGGGNGGWEKLLFSGQRRCCGDKGEREREWER